MKIFKSRILVIQKSFDMAASLPWPDFYKLKTDNQDNIIEKKEDINIYFKILDFSLNNHLQYKLEPEILCGNSYIKIEKIYFIDSINCFKFYLFTS